MERNTADSRQITTILNSDPDSRKKFDETLEFISLIVHDLQGPIASMKTLTKFLISGKYNPENDIHASLVRSSKNALERAEAIIHDLLESANEGNMALHLNSSEQDLRDIITDSVNALSGSAFDYGVTINKSLPKMPAMTMVDKYYLVRVVDNLLYNALKHSSGGKSINAAVAKNGDKYIITISDQGVGLDNVDVESLFDKYNQVTLNKGGKYRGIGLGLYYCRTAVTAMGGKIWAESKIGGGASFNVAFSASGSERK
jgi:signal transduction histidine kinase